MHSPYEDLRVGTSINMPWLQALVDRSDQIITQGDHGDLPGWLDVLSGLPDTEHFFKGNVPAPVLGKPVENPSVLARQLIKLHPWRKGPLNLGGVLIDSEWRANQKWDRLVSHLDLEGHQILDVGCGNGYYGWRMLGHGASLVIGIDPTLVYVMQWLACRHFSGPFPNYVLPLAIEDLPPDAGGFDTVFSMGVLYHRRDPVSHLLRLASLLRPGGQLVLESLILEGDGLNVLVPQSRYARMRNVWAIPSINQLIHWLGEVGFESIRTLDVSRTGINEQRSTTWMRFESLKESLDAEDKLKTIEGHPAPVRVAMLALAPS